MSLISLANDKPRGRVEGMTQAPFDGVTAMGDRVQSGLSAGLIHNLYPTERSEGAFQARESLAALGTTGGPAVSAAPADGVFLRTMLRQTRRCFFCFASQPDSVAESDSSTAL